MDNTVGHRQRQTYNQTEENAVIRDAKHKVTFEENENSLGPN